jgi:hypothetical protein
MVLTEVVGRYPKPEDSKPCAGTENSVAKVEKAPEVNQSIATLAIRFAAGLACRNA